MATAGQVIRAILSKIIVNDAEAPLESVDAKDTIFAMNNYMTALDADGINLGYTLVDSLNDVLTVAPGALQGIISNVAIIIAPDYDATVSPATVQGAELGLSAMRKLSRDIQPMTLPSTLPIGSGNENFFDDDQHFFPGSEEGIFTETNRNILLETDTDGC